MDDHKSTLCITETDEEAHIQADAARSNKSQPQCLDILKQFLEGNWTLGFLYFFVQIFFIQTGKYPIILVLKITIVSKIGIKIRRKNKQHRILIH